MLPNHRMKADLEIFHDNRESNKGWGREREGREHSHARLKIITTAHHQKGFMLTIHVV